MILGYHEAGQGPVLLLVHGFPVDGRIWQGQLEGLSESRRVVAVDLRGRGKSPAVEQEGWTMDTYADDVADTIRSLGVKKVDVAGFSMGGYVVFSLWRRHPDLVRSMVLLSTRPTEDPPEGKRGRARVAALVKQKGSAALAGMMFPKFFAPDVADEVQEAVRALLESIPASTAAADSLAMRQRPDSTPDLAGISVPALVVRGEQDALMPLQASHSMAQAIPGARFVAIANAGHFCLVENPSAVNAAISDFLDSL